MNRVVIAGGGTGGHLFPGIAVAEELRRRFPDLSILFVGTKRGIEARVLPEKGEHIEYLDVAPLLGRNRRDRIRNALRVPSAVAHAAALLLRWKPDLVIGVGGYASGPVLAAATILRFRTALLEQNAHVGLTNRLIAPVVGRAYITFDETSQIFRAASRRVVGNPIRRGFVDSARLAASDPDGFEARARNVLVLGGSQGARALNETVPHAIARVLARFPALTIVHQTGASAVEEVTGRYAALGISRVQVVPFIDDMARAYASAALVISRAGATTLAELSAIGRPSILIPFPHAAADHQAINAEAFAARGAAIAIRQEALTEVRLAEEVAGLLGDRARRAAMSDAARALGNPDAAASVVDDLCSWLEVSSPSIADAVREEPAESSAEKETEEEIHQMSSEAAPRRRKRRVRGSFFDASPGFGRTMAAEG